MFSSGPRLRDANLIAIVVALQVIGVMVVVAVHVAGHGYPMPSLVRCPRATVQAPTPPPDALEQVGKSLWAARPAQPPSLPVTPALPLPQAAPSANTATLPALPPLPEGPPLTTQPIAPVPAAPLPSGSPFIEKPTTREQPRIVMTNAARENVTIAFYGPLSQTVGIPAFQTVTVSLLPGDYTFSIWGETIPPRPGIAIFRRFNEYEATWVIESVPNWLPEEPIRIGDTY